MADKPSEVTQANEQAENGFNGKDHKTGKPLKDAKTVQDVNEAANAEFNQDEREPGIGNTVGGLRGASD